MGDKDGSKAMSIYIVVCFGLAMAALVGFKMLNDERDQLQADYVRLARQWHEVNVMADNVRNYYNLRADGEITAADRRQIDATESNLRNFLLRPTADGGLLGMNQNDMEVLPIGASTVRGTDVVRQGTTIRLRGLTQAQWRVFIEHVLETTSSYATIASLTLDRADKRYPNFRPVAGTDPTRWNIAIDLIWFVTA
jgi:hypothetical protein